MNISGYNSDSISTLFSSVKTTASKTTSSSSLADLTSTLTDYASIRSGAYHKLMKAYYETADSEDTSTSTSADSSKTLTGIKSSADALKDSATELQADSLYEKKTVTNADGTTSSQYDMDTLYKKVSSFVKNYNSLVENTGDSDTTTILVAESSMVSMTDKNKNLLSDIGITIGSDNKLTVDEKTFKNANMTSIKSALKGYGSYGYNVSSRASGIASYAATEASKSNTYTSNGTYTYNYSTGEIIKSEA